MKIRQIMTSEVFTVTESQNLNDAARLMWEHSIGSVPVLDEDNRPVAMITDRDIAMASYLNGRHLGDIPVSTAQSRELVCCNYEDNLETVEALMQQSQVHRIPVVGDDAKLKGIISINDIARAYLAGDRSVSAKGVSDTLGAICRQAPQRSQMASVA